MSKPDVDPALMLLQVADLLDGKPINGDLLPGVKEKAGKLALQETLEELLEPYKAQAMESPEWLDD